MVHEIQGHKNISSCIHCGSEDILEFGTTALGYNQYKCNDCKRQFNERSGTPFNRLEYPTDIVMLVVRWYLLYKLSLRDIVQMFQERNFEFSHETAYRT